MKETTVTVPTTDALTLQVYRWAPEGRPRAVVQIQHGLGEHAGRYRRFAEVLTDAGYLVYAPDGRGSGRSAKGNYGKWGRDGWTGWVEDLNQLNALISSQFRDLPIALFGHSMGSFASQQYLLDHSQDVDAVVLCGSGEPAAIAALLGGSEPTDLTAFNEGFEERTGFEWLSRDEDEVDRYVADPETAFPTDPFEGIEELAEAANPHRLAWVRADLPVLIISGTDDPVGLIEPGVEVVSNRYRSVGLKDVTYIAYPEARHELLNETNRDEVTADVIAFLDRTVGAG
ncbi:MAG TPA: alpha/beta hydrolase [Actinomycetaceae bacterium]|nr:alpha/beta hydrolase [Actinomycetaceae bacterium]